jgi:DNA repair photolyase
MKPTIENLIIEEKVRSTSLCRKLMESYPQAKASFCTTAGRPPAAMNANTLPARTLFLAQHRGRFIKPFPVHPWYCADSRNGCDHSLLMGYNCSASCLYCFTQSYFDHPYPTLFANTYDMVSGLIDFLRQNPAARISTGEFIDSFFLDSITGTSEQILKVMSSFPGSTIEFRSKSSMVDHLPYNEHPRAIAAWSLNPPEVIHETEAGTASFSSRLEAALRLYEKGYKIALRIDPIIMVEAYRQYYADLADAIAEKLGWKAISEVYLGTLRLNRKLLLRLASHRESVRMLDAEYILCPDGKFRPDKFTRIRYYSMIISSIRGHAPELPIHITMEPAYIHDAVLCRTGS